MDSESPGQHDKYIFNRKEDSKSSSNDKESRIVYQEEVKLATDVLGNPH